ncbi:alpha/beta fold hydrolase [Altererythrobacter indicus]|uniref:Alpha/beta fold hydrolase n=1 Tax=Altericroceibacterium indicum TaxID=374177 RepID=A0A845A5H4_9SPHN|nr:alpha/beta hydrolase [Altericroceibacterium indicum]MXP24523.1 alpha/beta fold hydrolase [Altericroceibacterium indicum]
MSETTFTHGTWLSADGLTLSYTEYPGNNDHPPILCIPGLTRNARDFEPIADAFAGEWRVICPDLRGRGLSDYAKDPASYTPETYVDDIEALLEQLGLEKVVVIGTSLGGIVTMLLAARNPAPLAGVVLNDIGPMIEAAGIDRIREYVGQGRTFPTWMHAARAMKDTAGAAHPDFDISDWLTLSKRLMCLSGNGRITFDYDMKIADNFETVPEGPQVDMWQAYRALSGRPVLAIRGQLSDLLSETTLARMSREIPDVETITVPRVGHTPMLSEEVAQSAIARLLARVSAAQN